MILFALAGCGKHLLLHPTTASQFESEAKDTIDSAKRSIDQARPQLPKLPLTSTALFNRLVASYDIASAEWKTYQAASKAGTKIDSAPLGKSLDDLSAALEAFRKGGQN